MLFRIVSIILTLFLVVACSPKQAVKEDKADIAAAPLPKQAEELKLPELQQKPPEAEKKKTETVLVEKEADQKYVILNFDNADIDTVISTVGELLNINYILAPGVTGKVTIQSYRKFPVKDLYQIFQTILEVNGLTAVKDGTLYRIVPIDSAKQQPVEVQSGKELKLQLDSSFITQIMPLDYVKANDVVNILRSLMPRGADLIVYEPTNLLIITAPPAGLVKCMKILEAIDIPATDRESIRTFVYYVENGDAKKLAEVLRSLYAEKKEKTTVPARTVTPIPPVPAGTQPKTPAQATAQIIEGLPGEVSGEIVITAYDDINGLIIKASPNNYLAILETLKKLDIPAKQVLIEVLVAEVSLTDETQFGIEWLLQNSLFIKGENFKALSGFDTGTGGTSPTSKLNVNSTTQVLGSPFASVIKPEKFSLLLTAFAGLGNLNVLASPHILAVDNKEAKIEIGSEVPIATGLTQQPVTTATSVNATLVTTGQIQYKTVGTILTVTPHITEKNQVTLKISQESSGLGKEIPVASQNFQSFDTRKAQTTAVVQSGHTLVIGGLIEERRNETRSGIPWLSKIPILGYLFSTTDHTVDKTELLVMVTPHVINNPEEADLITKEFQNKIKTIKERLADVGANVLSISKDVATVRVEKKERLAEILEANGYYLKDADVNAFMSEFVVLNEDIKDADEILAGSVVRLPLGHLKKINNQPEEGVKK